MDNRKPYKISEVNGAPGVWYCHAEGYNYIPVFGSIGTKNHASEICKMMNRSIGARSGKS